MTPCLGAKIAASMVLAGVVLLSLGITGKVIVLIIKFCTQ